MLTLHSNSTVQSSILRYSIRKFSVLEFLKASRTFLFHLIIWNYSKLVFFLNLTKWAWLGLAKYFFPQISDRFTDNIGYLTNIPSVSFSKRSSTVWATKFSSLVHHTQPSRALEFSALDVLFNLYHLSALLDIHRFYLNVIWQGVWVTYGNIIKVYIYCTQDLMTAYF